MTNETEIISAAASGDRNAQFTLGKMYRDGVSVPQDDKKAIQWFTSSADNGHIRAKYELAVMLEKKNLKKDEKRITSLLESAYRAGDADAGMRLASKTAESDPEAARKIYKKLSDNGSALAAIRLSEMYYKSESREDRLDSIRICYELSLKGNKDAMFRLYLHYRYGVGVKSNPELAREWLKKAADAGHKGAANEAYE